MDSLTSCFLLAIILLTTGPTPEPKYPTLAETVPACEPVVKTISPPFVYRELQDRAPDGRLRFQGYVSYYAEQVSLAQIAYFEERHGKQPAGTVYGAVPNCDAVGMSGVLLHGSRPLPFVVFDCGGSGQDTGHNWMLKNSIAVEIDYHSAQAFPSLPHNWTTILLDG